MDDATLASDALSRWLLIHEGEAEFFDYWIGQDFPGNALDLGVSLFARQAARKRKLEIFSLANAFQSFVAHLVERSLDGLTLGVENGLFEGDVDVSNHGS